MCVRVHDSSLYTWCVIARVCSWIDSAVCSIVCDINLIGVWFQVLTPLFGQLDFPQEDKPDTIDYSIWSVSVILVYQASLIAYWRYCVGYDREINVSQWANASRVSVPLWSRLSVIWSRARSTFSSSSCRTRASSSSATWWKRWRRHLASRCSL